MADQNVTYKIAVGLYDDSVSTDQMKELEFKSGLQIHTHTVKQVYETRPTQIYVCCYAGDFTTREEAELWCEKLKQKGFDRPFVQVFIDGEPVTFTH